MGKIIQLTKIPEDIKTYLTSFKENLNHIKIIYSIHNKYPNSPYTKEHSLLIIPKDNNNNNLTGDPLSKKIATLIYTQLYEGDKPTLDEFLRGKSCEPQIPLDYFNPYYIFANECLLAHLNYYYSTLKHYKPSLFNQENKELNFIDHEKEINIGKIILENKGLYGLEHIFIGKESPSPFSAKEELAQNF